MKPTTWPTLFASAAVMAMTLALPAVPGDAEDSGEDPLTEIFGEGGMELKALGENGGMTAEFDEETEEMKTMHIWGQIDLASELMNLKCEDIAIDLIKQELVAKGKRVDFQKDDIEGHCGLLTYDIENKKTHLVGIPKPFIRQKQANGSVRQTSADKIVIVKNEKSNNILWDGNPELSVVPGPGEKKDSDKEKAPKKIEGRNVREIPGSGSAR